MWFFISCPLKLTHKAPIMTAADNKFCNIFPKFRKKIRHNITWELSAADNFHEISCLICFFLKKRQNLKLSSAANYRCALWVNQLKQHTNHACSEIYSHSLNELSGQKQKSIDPLDSFHAQNKEILSEGVQLCQLFFFSWWGEWGSKYMYHYEQGNHLPASKMPFNWHFAGVSMMAQCWMLA